jgi:hypothetical protein
VCSKIARVEDRKQCLRSTGRCFICLKQGHLSRTCRSSNKCKQCNGRHHSSICFKGSSGKEGHESTSLNPAATPLSLHHF